MGRVALEHVSKRFDDVERVRDCTAGGPAQAIDDVVERQGVPTAQLKDALALGRCWGGRDIRCRFDHVEDIPSLEHPSERVQGGVPSLDLNVMTAWYGGEEGGHIGELDGR